MEIAGLPALEIARLVSSGDVSPVEVVDATLARIAAVNPSVNAFAWTRADAARRDARDAERRVMAGRGRGLEGVPFTVKDLCAIEDGPTTMGSRAFEGFSYGVDATLVARLKDAGAILVATTTTSELGNRPTCETTLFGATRNPWNPERTSGGSSGGAAVAAALGIAPLNQGSDGGGSVRVPAACCGVYGIKPQRGRLSLGPVLSEEWGGLDVYGPITRTVADAAVLLDICGGPASGDPYWTPPPARSFLSAVDEDHPLRIAFAVERDGERVDPAQRDAVIETAKLLASLGHTVEEAQPDLLPLEPSFLTLSGVGIAAHPLADEQLALLEPRTRFVVEAGRTITGVEYTEALHRMHRHTRAVMPFFDTYDALLTPTISRTAPSIGEVGASVTDAWQDYRNWLCWTWPWNCTGQPAASVPAGFDGDGLPRSVQIVGRPADERTVLALSAQLERARPWAAVRPPSW